MGILHRALFIDRDGTINRDCPYCKDPSDLFIYDDAVRLMKQYKKSGYLVIVVTNQSGIGRGYFTTEQLDEFNNRMKEELKGKGVELDDIYYCPHLPEDGCNCRKPMTGMVKQAAREHEIMLEQSIMVGDRDDIDGEMARRLGMHFRKMSHDEEKSSDQEKD